MLSHWLCVRASYWQSVLQATRTSGKPAEERTSAGAVVLEKWLVQAQKKAFVESAARPGASSIGRGVMRATRAQMRAERASARAAEAADPQRLGAGALTGR